MFIFLTILFTDKVFAGVNIPCSRPLTLSWGPVTNPFTFPATTACGGPLVLGQPITQTSTTNNNRSGYSGSESYTCGQINDPGFFFGNRIITVQSWTCDVAVTTGTINVSANIPSASWTISGPTTFPGSGTSQSSTSQPAGTYLITWDAVPGYIAPANYSRTLLSGGTISFSGNYTASPTVNLYFSLLNTLGFLSSYL